MRDVPFFLEPRPSIARGIGEILEPIARWPELWYLIVTPRFQVSTAWVYGNLRLGLTSNEYGRIKDQLGKESLVISQFLENDLESVTSAKFPMLDRIKKTLLDAGAEGALMTGSGPTVFVDGVVIVTEWGIADLRELTVGGKALALAAISHPNARDELLRYVTDDPMFTKPVGFAPGRTPRGVTMYSGKIAIDEK